METEREEERRESADRRRDKKETKKTKRGKHMLKIRRETENENMNWLKKFNSDHL